MQTIETRYHGPTDHRGARITATTTSGLRVTVPYDYSISAHENYAHAAKTLAKRLSWSLFWLGGATQKGYVFVPRIDQNDYDFCITECAK
jgi:hypothetical protein